jgi:16S rRNA (cytosine1402-N4)-methyltransferase
MPPFPPHVSVLLSETVGLLVPGPGRRFLDCTLGAGGHTAALLEAGASVTAIDRDPRARELARARLAGHGERLTILDQTFSVAGQQLVEAGTRFDGVLADLGVSSMQIDDAGRGFSLRDEGRADMRMGDGCAVDAIGLIDQLEEGELADIIYRYGEERLSRRIASALKRARDKGIESAAGLAESIRGCIPGHQPRHPAIRTFQALRIAVNDELGELERLLAVIHRLVAPGSCAVVISFHSLEDRQVKLAFKAGQDRGRWSDIVRRPVIASDDEIAANPRSHSAKLRWARKAAVA